MKARGLKRYLNMVLIKYAHDAVPRNDTDLICEECKLKDMDYDECCRASVNIGYEMGYSDCLSDVSDYVDREVEKNRKKEIHGMINKLTEYGFTVIDNSNDVDYIS